MHQMEIILFHLHCLNNTEKTPAALKLCEAGPKFNGALKET